MVIVIGAKTIPTWDVCPNAQGIFLSPTANVNFLNSTVKVSCKSKCECMYACICAHYVASEIVTIGNITDLENTVLKYLTKVVWNANKTSFLKCFWNSLERYNVHVVCRNQQFTRLLLFASLYIYIASMYLTLIYIFVWLEALVKLLF